MPDVLFVVLTVAFFVLANGVVTLCDRVIGADPAMAPDPELLPAVETPERAASEGTLEEASR